MHVVGEQLPHGAVVDLGIAEPGSFERHALRIEHPHDVVVGADEEPAGRVEPCRGVGEEAHVDVPVRADDRQFGDVVVELGAEARRFDVAIGSQVRHSPSPGFGMSTSSRGKRSSASANGR